MRFSTFASVALLIAPIFALPALNSEERKLFGRDSGSYTVSGLGARKKAVIAAGGNVFDIAIAMLETETMTTDYTYGDGKTCKFFFWHSPLSSMERVVIRWPRENIVKTLSIANIRRKHTNTATIYR